MSENRVRRVAEQIKKDISTIIGAQIKDPRIAAITSVTEVRLTRDMRYATIYISVYGSDLEKQETLETLVRATGFIRGEIGRKIRLRYTPEINFSIDNSMEYGAHIERIIKSLQDKEECSENG